MITLNIGLSQTDNILQFLGVCIIFLFILAATYFTTKYVGGVKLGQLKNHNFNVLETYKVAQNKYLQLIQIGTRYFVISVGKDDIRLITELNENELKLPDQATQTPSNFIDIFNKIIKKQNNEKIEK